MIDLNSEHLLKLTEAARLRPLGRMGRPTHVSTVYRWIFRGIRGVKLEAVRIGGCLYTSREAMQRFAVRLTGDPSGTPAEPLVTPRSSEEDHVDEALSRHGYS